MLLMSRYCASFGIVVVLVAVIVAVYRAADHPGAFAIGCVLRWATEAVWLVVRRCPAIAVEAHSAVRPVTCSSIGGKLREVAKKILPADTLEYFKEQERLAGKKAQGRQRESKTCKPEDWCSWPCLLPCRQRHRISARIGMPLWKLRTTRHCGLRCTSRRETLRSSKPRSLASTKMARHLPWTRF